MADQADTVELSEEVKETFLLHNRLFQRYAISNNTYFAPVDEDETLRLRIQHGVLTMMFDNRFIFPPIDVPRRVLDCGFGTGEWALYVAWKHPRCEVRGIDITPHHHNPDEGLENLYLDIDDLNMSFQFPSNHFDLINSRLVAGGINSERWTGYIRDMFRCLRPGGWVQMVEIDFNAQSDNGAIADNSALRQWSQTYLYAMEQCKNPRAPRRLGGWLRNAGFTEVDERMIPLPMCAWPDADQRNHDIGAANQENVRMLLSSVALYPFTHYLNMSITEFHVLVAKARAEAANPALKPYFPLYVCVGRKPRR
ncbi:S-adenosyl-L-methionine-dependent methyltransferase [Xylaria palmicola]|nr:S-adenosyl-L-methionine-dependent methyltransferase [Xylaria palmicola]